MPFFGIVVNADWRQSAFIAADAVYEADEPLEVSRGKTTVVCSIHDVSLRSCQFWYLWGFRRRRNLSSSELLFEMPLGGITRRRRREAGGPAEVV